MFSGCNQNIDQASHTVCVTRDTDVGHDGAHAFTSEKSVCSNVMRSEDLVTTRRMHLPPPPSVPRDSTLESVPHCLTCRSAESSANAYLTTNAEGAPIPALRAELWASGPGPGWTRPLWGQQLTPAVTPSRQHCQNMSSGNPPSTGIAERRLSQTPYRRTDALSGVSAFHPRALLQANHTGRMYKRAKTTTLRCICITCKMEGGEGRLGGSIWTGEAGTASRPTLGHSSRGWRQGTYGLGHYDGMIHYLFA